MTTSFDLNALISSPVATQNSITQIPCNNLIPYHKHRFALYSGERLDDMVESIKQNGVLTPLVVQPINNGKYEILIGHNRWNAAMLADLPSVPAIIKTDLTEEEAETYVNESNVIQRGFDNLLISEQASVIADRYNKLFDQGKRNDILRELQIIENPNIALLDEKSVGGNSREKVGAEYGLSRNSVARLIRIDTLQDDLKNLVDNGEMSIRAAVDISYLPETTQDVIAMRCTGCHDKVDMKKAKLLRNIYKEKGAIEQPLLIRILSGEYEKDEKRTKPKTFKLRYDTFSKYFNDDTDNAEVTEVVEKALEMYFENN